MKDFDFLKKYFKKIINLIDDEKYLNDLLKVKDILIKTLNNKKKL